MNKIEMFKALLPFIPTNYRRPLLFYIHFEELMNIMASLNSCLKSPLSDYTDSSAKDPSELINLLKKNMSEQDAEIFNMLSNMQNMSSLFSAMNNMGDFSNTENSSDKSDEFSDEIDDLFKDFITETQK